MIKKIIASLIFTSLLFGEESGILTQVSEAEAEGYWKSHHLASIGYRRDRQKWEQSISRSDYVNRNSLELHLSSYLELAGVVFDFRGSYGWLVNGNLSFSTTNEKFPESLKLPNYSLGAGYSADVYGKIGYCFKPVKGKSFSFNISPLVGYAYSHMMNFAQGEKRANTWFSKPNQQDWFGPFVEANMSFLFSESFEWICFYRYYWLDLRGKSSEVIDLFRASTIVQANHISRQMGGTDFRYRFKSGFNLGLHFEGASAWTEKAKYQFHFSDLTRINKIGVIQWVYYETDASIGYQF